MFLGRVAVILSVLILSQTSLSAGEIETEYGNELLRHKVHQNDKIIIIRSWYRYNFKFKLLKERIINYKNSNYRLDDKLLKLLEASDTKGWKDLKAFLSGPFTKKSYSDLDYSERVRLYKLAEELIDKAIGDFNKACLSSPEARKRITDVYVSLIGNFIDQEIEYKKKKGKKLLFVNFVVGTPAVGPDNTISADASSYRTLLNVGLRASYYFKHPYDKFNFGFAFQVSYMNVFDLTKYENDFSASVKYLDFATLFIMKFYAKSRNHSLHLGLGPVFSFRMGGLKSYTKVFAYSTDTYTYDTKGFVYGGVAEIGYLYTSSNLAFNLFVNLFVRLDRPHFSKYVNGIKEKNTQNIFVGMLFGIGFNLM